MHPDFLNVPEQERSVKPPKNNIIKIYFIFFKKLLTNVLAFDKIGLALRKSQNNNADARVAQLVEHDLAKVGVAGSSPVSRSL